MYSTVHPTGSTPNTVLLVGEAPGEEEAHRGQPFVGKAGREQDWYLGLCELSSKFFRRTNVILQYTEGNPDPTPSQIEYYTPILKKEIITTHPKLIVAVGRFAAKWFLGEDTDMRAVHGLPHRAGAFDISRKDRGGGAVIVPVYHPAAGLYDTNIKATIAWDYKQVARVLGLIEKCKTVDVAGRDWFEGKEIYIDIPGYNLTHYLSPSGVVSIDTEGTYNKPWSIQISTISGESVVIRNGNHLEDGIKILQEYIFDFDTKVIMHNAMFDLAMCRAMGLDLSRTKIFDTMYGAYLLRTEPQGLKPLAWRWCGMRMKSYKDVVGDIGIIKQLAYLNKVVELNLPKPEPWIVYNNDGTANYYKPHSITMRSKSILNNYHSGKVNKDGERTNLYKRWDEIDRAIKGEVENNLGTMPRGTLADLPLREAIDYSARDADATLRLYYALKSELSKQGLDNLMSEGMEVLPIFEEIQSNGMPASRKYFESLSKEMWKRMTVLQTHLSYTYFDSRPFNPASPKDVRELLKIRGHKGTKKTPKGEVSTGKPSIEYLRFIDDAFSDVFDWRELQHTKDTFCNPVLNRIPEDEDIHPIRCRIKITRTATRRLASAKPNLLAVSAHDELGKKIRNGYMCKEEEVFAAWDLSQIEMRFIAHDSQDELLCRRFGEGADIHSETAAAIFGIRLEDVDNSKHRLPAKTTGFGIIYGIAGPSLYTQFQMLGLTGWTVESCSDLITEWMKLYGGVDRYIKDSFEELGKTGEVRDVWGMPRYLPSIWSNDTKEVAEAGRIAVSHKIQGGAQGMIQRSMAYLGPIIRGMQEGGLNIKWVLQIHDEIILKIDKDVWDTINPIVLDALTKRCGIELRVPVEAEGHVSETWGGLK